MILAVPTRGYRLLKVLLLLLLVSVVALLGYSYASLPSDHAGEDAPVGTTLHWPATEGPESATWSVFQQPTSPAASSLGPLAKRFRLAGTYFAFGSGTGEENSRLRRAILDDLKKDTQYLVREGDEIEGFTVARIFPERITLRSQTQEEELWLSFSGRPGLSKQASAKEASTQDKETILETNRFGKRVGQSRWVFKRDSLMGYYHELLDDPERLASLYLSMKPDYLDGQLKGYYVDMEGEEDFFATVGLKEGDVVRRVNSMNMVSQARAEYFIREFVKGRLGAVVLDVDRAGEQEKLIYLIR